jgi:hypothetical protein
MTMTERDSQIRQEFFKAVETPAFDWRKLTVLGVSPEEAEAIASKLAIKKQVTRYWQKLVRLGVPADDAIRIARAVAKYDAARTMPTLKQKQLISQYCPMVCRSGLWRSKLLLSGEG